MSVARMLPRFRKAYASLSEYAERESWSRDSIEQLQLERINSLWQQAVAHVAYYRDLSQTRSIPSRFSSLQELNKSLRCN